MSQITLPEGLERVILVCAANWSGSTMVGAVMGATEDGPLNHFHVGELHAYNNPKKEGRTYGNPLMTAKLTDFWSDVKPHETGPGLIADITRKSGCKSYIDSSKLTAWFIPVAKVCAENECR